MIKKINKYASVLTFFLFIQISGAQVSITVPTGNLNSSGLTHSEWRKPMGSYFGYERSAFIYTHAEIGQYGTINSISFYCDTVNNPGNTPVSVYMKEVPGSLFSTTSTVANEESGATLVYSDTIPAASFVKGQWVTLVLANPFLHATSNSIEIIVETNASGTGNEISLAKGFYHYVTSIYAFQHWSADNSAPTGLGTLSYKRPNIQFDLNPVSACAGTPTGGTTMASADTSCSAITLSLSGSTAASGITYQWEDSLAGGGWAAISGATASVFIASISADTWFRCVVSCGSQSSYSSVKQIVKRNYLECYCISGLGGGCSSSAIDSVAIETTSLVSPNTGCATNNYIQYPALANTSAQLASGQNYNLHTRFDGIVIASVWIDYDQSGQFDSAEWKQITTTAKVDSDYVTVLSVPANAKTGLTLMRIRTRSAGNLNGYADACTNFGSGETEDYFIGINYDVNVSQTLVKDDEIRIYPNPAKETVSITGNFKIGQNVHIQIFSGEGVLLDERAENFTGDLIQTNVSNLAPGIYFLSLDGGGTITVKKLVITR